MEHLHMKTRTQQIEELKKNGLTLAGKASRVLIARKRW
jgi:hypothetical protein